jgi:hypothetical protein
MLAIKGYWGFLGLAIEEGAWAARADELTAQGRSVEFELHKFFGDSYFSYAPTANKLSTDRVLNQFLNYEDLRLRLSFQRSAWHKLAEMPGTLSPYSVPTLDIVADHPPKRVRCTPATLRELARPDRRERGYRGSGQGEKMTVHQS